MIVLTEILDYVSETELIIMLDEKDIHKISDYGTYRLIDFKIPGKKEICVKDCFETIQEKIQLAGEK